jgi:hypothetical protein
MEIKQVANHSFFSHFIFTTLNIDGVFHSVLDGHLSC